MTVQYSGQAADVVLTPQDLADRWTTTTGALAQQRYRGDSVPFVRIGKRTIRYRLADVLAYEEAQRFTRTDRRVGVA